MFAVIFDKYTHDTISWGYMYTAVYVGKYHTFYICVIYSYR